MPTKAELTKTVRRLKATVKRLEEEIWQHKYTSRHWIERLGTLQKQYDCLLRQGKHKHAMKETWGPLSKSPH